MQLTINDKEYNFKFGIGFVRKMDGKSSFEKSGIRFGMGLESTVPKLLMNDVVTLSDMLITANETENPKVKQGELECYIDDEGTEIEQLFEGVVEELKKSNATRLKVAALMKEVENAEETEKAIKSH